MINHDDDVDVRLFGQVRIKPSGAVQEQAHNIRVALRTSKEQVVRRWAVVRTAGFDRAGGRHGPNLADRCLGFRVPKAEALRLARERIEKEAGRKLSDRELAKLIDEVIATNEERA
jgi:hypothetical protein